MWTAPPVAPSAVGRRAHGPQFQRGDGPLAVRVTGRGQDTHQQQQGGHQHQSRTCSYEDWYRIFSGVRVMALILLRKWCGTPGKSSAVPRAVAVPLLCVKVLAVAPSPPTPAPPRSPRERGSCGRSGTRCAQEPRSRCCRNSWWRATDPTSHSARSGGPAPYTDTAYTRWNSLLVKLSNILNWGSCGAVGRSGTRCAQEWCCRNRWWRATDPTSHSARSGGPAPYTDTGYTRWNSLLDSSETVKHT